MNFPKSFEKKNGNLAKESLKAIKLTFLPQK
jgi:hypothetical protein